jgi:hypothetical protein
VFVDCPRAAEAASYREDSGRTPGSVLKGPAQEVSWFAVSEWFAVCVRLSQLYLAYNS